MATHIRIHETGGPEVMKVETVDVGAPGPGEVRLRQSHCGVNFIDTYHRSGLYPVGLPSGIGLEGLGIVEALGDGVTEFKEGTESSTRRVPLVVMPTSASCRRRNSFECRKTCLTIRSAGTCCGL